MTYLEQVSELFQAGWRLMDIASLTPWSRRALFLPRDEHGKLIREDSDLPTHVKTDKHGRRKIGGRRLSLEEAYRRVNMQRGLSTQQIDEGWKKFVEENPGMGKGGPQRRRRRKG